MKYLVLCCLLLSVFVSDAEPKPLYKIVDDKIGASLIKIAVPEKWNKDVLIFAHGLRALEWPLTADFSTDDALFKALVREGWMVASTSYRRNGYIVDEATDDIDQLRDYIVENYGEPKRVFLVGSSMGGAVVIQMAETREAKYSGALAIGTILHKPIYMPKIPLLMMSNQNEIDGPREYVQKTSGHELKAACWMVTRDGHCNITSAEVLNAFRAVVKWCESGEIALDADGTIVAPPPQSVAVFADGAATAKVTKLASGGGSCDTEFTAADMVKLGIPLRSRFKVFCKGKTVAVLYGTTYSDVLKGEWVAFIRAEGGHLCIARNYADAVTVLGCVVGDKISIAPNI